MPLRSASAALRRAARQATGIVVLVTVASSCYMAHPRTSPEPAPAGLGAHNVEIRSASGSLLRGWFARGRHGAGAVLLLHGVGADRRVMLGRMRFLHDAGFSVLAPDFPGHGESSDAPVTYGARESLDARSAVSFLRDSLPGERVGVIGISMGGAAAVLGDSILPVDAMVLESVYPTIRDAVRDRLHAWLGPVRFTAGPLTPLVLRVVGAGIGVSEQQLRPIERIRDVRAPLLMLAGTRDPYTPIDESRALFAHATAAKSLWEVDGAKHEDLHAFTPTEYEHRVGGFLVEHLRGNASVSALLGAADAEQPAGDWKPADDLRSHERSRR